MLAVLASLTTPPDGFHAPGTEIFDYTHESLCLVGSGDFCIQKVSLLVLLSAVFIIGLLRGRRSRSPSSCRSARSGTPRASSTS